jgi:hypothetical protein
MSTAVLNTVNKIFADFFRLVEQTSDEDGGLDWETVVAIRKIWDENQDAVKAHIDLDFPKKVRAKKDKKPKNAPKNPKSAYIFYCQEKRAELKVEKPDLPAKDVLRELGALWKGVDEEEKEKYKKMAEDDKGRYKNDMENYDPNEPEAEKPKKERKKKVKGAPKNPRSAYIFFGAKNRDEVKTQNPDLASKDITKKLAEMWKAIKDTEEAKEYKTMAEEDKIRHKEEMENFVPENDAEKPAPKKRGRKPKKVEVVVEEVEEVVVEEVDEEVEETPLTAKDVIRDIFKNNEKVTKKKVREILKDNGFDMSKKDADAIIAEVLEEED